MTKKPIAILGSGSWGTAVAIHLAKADYPILLWGHNAQHIQQMIARRENTPYLPGIRFPENLTPIAHLDECLQLAQEVIIAVPSHAFVATLDKIKTKPDGLSWLTKGVDPLSHHLLSDIVKARYGKHFPVAVISGPSFAKEVAHALPTALTIASNNLTYQKKIHQLLHNDNIRVYLTEDLIGVQLCGAVKNVLAIACGISDGLQYGANAKAALITRGLAEMSRLGLSLGAKAETFLGLAGVGDLVLTCTDNQSRNRRFGLLLGQNWSVEAAEQQIGQVVEGKYNAHQITLLAKEKAIEMPICEQVNALLQLKIDAHQAVKQLMKRPPKDE